MRGLSCWGYEEGESCGLVWGSDWMNYGGFTSSVVMIRCVI